MSQRKVVHYPYPVTVIETASGIDVQNNAGDNASVLFSRVGGIPSKLFTYIENFSYPDNQMWDGNSGLEGWFDPSGSGHYAVLNSLNTLFNAAMTSASFQQIENDDKIITGNFVAPFTLTFSIAFTDISVDCQFEVNIRDGDFGVAWDFTVAIDVEDFGLGEVQANFSAPDASSNTYQFDSVVNNQVLTLAFVWDGVSLTLNGTGAVTPDPALGGYSSSQDSELTLSLYAGPSSDILAKQMSIKNFSITGRKF